jgi:O-antigen/teichoic acid export membrane protein
LSLVDRVARGTIALWLVTAVNMLGQIATVPIALHAWGKLRYGEWVALTALVGFLALTDLGVQAHVVNRMTAHHARGDTRALLDDLHSAVRVQWPLAGLLWAVGAGVSALLPLNAWYGVSTASRVEVYLTVILLGAELLIGVATGSIAGTYRATGHLPRSAVLTAVQRLVIFALPLGMMLAGASFAAIALARVLWALVIVAFTLIDLPRLHGWFSLRPLLGDARAGLRMLGPGSLFLIAGFADYLTLHGTVMVVQSSIGGAEVTQLATHRILVNMGRMISSQFTTATWPELTALEARGESVKLARVHRTLSKLNGWLVGAVLLAFLPMSRSVYSAWTLRTLTLDATLFAIMVAQTILWGAWSASSTVLVATNRQGRLVSILLLDAAVGVGLSLVLIPHLGIRGAAVAGLAADLAIASWAAPFTACKAIGDRLRDHLREVVPVLLGSLVFPVIVAGGLWLAVPWPPARIVLIPMLGLALGTAILWKMLAPPERTAAERLMSRLRQKLGRAS